MKILIALRKIKGDSLIARFIREAAYKAQDRKALNSICSQIREMAADNREIMEQVLGTQLLNDIV